MNINNILNKGKFKQGLVIGAIVGILAEVAMTNDIAGLAKYIGPVYVGFAGILGPVESYATYIFPAVTALIGALIGSRLKR